MLFPGDTFTQSITMTINKDEIEKIKSSGMNHLLPTVWACIIYYFTFEPGVHLTCLPLEIYKAPGITAIPADDKPVPIQELILRYAALGSGYAD